MLRDCSTHRADATRPCVLMVNVTRSFHITQHSRVLLVGPLPPPSSLTLLPVIDRASCRGFGPAYTPGLLYVPHHCQHHLPSQTSHLQQAAGCPGWCCC
jgi:hypothetical protein